MLHNHLEKLIKNKKKCRSLIPHLIRPTQPFPSIREGKRKRKKKKNWKHIVIETQRLCFVFVFFILSEYLKIKQTHTYYNHTHSCHPTEINVEVLVRCTMISPPTKSCFFFFYFTRHGTAVRKNKNKKVSLFFPSLPSPPNQEQTMYSSTV